MASAFRFTALFTAVPSRPDENDFLSRERGICLG